MRDKHLVSFFNSMRQFLLTLGLDTFDILGLVYSNFWVNKTSIVSKVNKNLHLGTK